MNPAEPKEPEKTTSQPTRKRSKTAELETEDQGQTTRQQKRNEKSVHFMNEVNLECRLLFWRGEGWGLSV